MCIFKGIFLFKKQHIGHDDASVVSHQMVTLKLGYQTCEIRVDYVYQEFSAPLKLNITFVLPQRVSWVGLTGRNNHKRQL